VNAEEFGAAVRSERTEARMIRAFAALLGRESGLGSEGLTVVGGSALEIYTEGAYVSQDVDLLAEGRVQVEKVLRRWGFRSKGVCWVGSALPLSVQIVGRYDSGSRPRNRILSTRYGQVRLASLEDIVVKRLIEARHWNRREALAEAALSAERVGARMDWEYAEFIAKRYGVSDLAADLRRRSGSSGAAADDIRADLRRE
jgi:hypothetical protein